MRHTEVEYDRATEAEIRTGAQARPPAGGPLDAGTDLELNGNLPGAYEVYDRALEKTPDDQALRIAAGRLAASLLRYADAVRWLEPAQARATYDTEIAYYLGLSYQGLGRIREARLQFEAARRMPQFRAAASLKLGELLARAGEREIAAAYLEEAGDPPIPLRSPDAERVLTVAAQSMRLGQWREALAVLTREYPPAPVEQTEPGVPLPQRHPLVAYYRAFCRKKLGDSFAADYDLAAKLPTAYVFPNGAQTLDVLEGAVRERPGDATAHFLLGDLRMASGLVDAALQEWRTAQKLNPALPVLQANLGRTLLEIKHDIPAAAEAFRAGLGADPANAEIYAGLATALGILGRPAAELAAAFERYPDAAHMPAALVYDRALTLAEAGRFDDATALFQGRFFPREEGGTNVRQIWIRVRALEAQSGAAAGRCDAALAIVDHIGEASGQLAFTRDGMERFLAAPPNQAALGLAEARCGRVAAAGRRLQGLSDAGDADSLVFAYELARQLPGFQAGQWTAKLQAASRRNPVIAGLLELDLGHTKEGRALIESALLLPDRNLSHHLGRVTLR